ncbi:MAG: DMT family transporter [Clostridia bacterium]|nr:DMT family transporter [Clostridia bacterium]
MKSNKIFTNPVFVTLAAIFCCALWGSATPFIKTGYRLMFPAGGPDLPSTILFAGIRFALAGLLTVVIYSVARRRLLLPKRESLGIIGLISVFQTIIQYFFFYVGLANTTGAKGTILSGSSSFFAIIISCIFFKQERLTVKKIIACIVGFAGIIAVNLNGLDFSMNLLGDAFVLFSGVSLGISSVLMKKFSGREDPVVISGYQFMLGGAVMAVVGFAFGGRVDLSSPVGVLVLVYLSALSAVAYALWGVLLKHNPVSKVTIFSFTTPVFGVILTKLMLPDESQIHILNLLISLLLVALGVFMLNYVPRQKKTASDIQPEANGSASDASLTVKEADGSASATPPNAEEKPENDE